ncbi:MULTISPECIES: FAD/NAD(P)-binding protein [unclassified Streptomyces]|uniref:FAD/NAD(P)-binding protein n=1 Tax=unclassified Streptomyces TaxID=2593676 RepID=UPI0022597606|nr:MULTISPECIES: FAD/NAD(P)-binding protein [unclassified Streptomyces]MCX4527203.1 FAD/NAD(P)-binding protein [Streptomyces sp. NBC_01551]MCX4542221.1 FAD/NAD(P)-binding protein [Streptomyces sp. NBC_01565]
MSRNSPPRHIAVVGAGAAGTLTAVQLMRQAEDLGRTLEVWLVDPAEQAGPGVAYRTSDPRHLLNVPAGRMSALPDDPEHFLRWLADGHPRAAPGDYVPRQEYGRYLTEVLERTAEACRRTRPHRVRERVSAVREHGAGVTLRLTGGGELRVDAAVLALGNFAPGQDWAGPELRESGRFVADPWAPGALEALPEEGDVLLVGTGLTMADLAVTLARPDRVLHAVSRHGYVPREHLEDPLPSAEPPSLDGTRGLDALRRDVRRHLAASRRACGDWRAGMDGLRPVTATLWQQLSPADRIRFLQEDLRAWEVHRHRIAPVTAARIGALRTSGRLRIGAAEVVRAVPDEGAVAVRLSDGRELRVAAVVNCTGAQADLRRTADPLVRCLLDRGYARTGPADLGFDTWSGGRLVPAPGAPALRLWTIGVARRGNLLESTAIPEIRTQAAEVASSVLGALADRHASRPTDRYGLRLTTTPEAAELYDRALERILAGRLGAEALLAEAVGVDPDFAVGHAALALLCHESGVGANTAAALAAAGRAASRGADERERSLVGAVRARLTGTEEAGKAALLGHIAGHPRDALVVSAAVPTVSFNGVTRAEESWALVEGLSPTYGDDWWYLGQLAFVRQEQERWQEAESLSARALAAHPAAGHAVHAWAHVFYETGEHRAGLAWLDEWMRRHGAGAGHRSHLSWHAALHELTLDDRAAVLRRYRCELVASRVSGGRLLVDSASLLWRARMTGSWSGELPLGELLEAAPDQWLDAPETAFAALHGALAFAAAGDLDGLGRLRLHALTNRQEAFRLVIAPLCEALTAVVGQRWQEAALRLGPLLPLIARVGGSKAQHEVVEETLLHALISGDDHDRAARLLSARLERRASPLDRRRLATVGGASQPLEAALR